MKNKISTILKQYLLPCVGVMALLPHSVNAQITINDNQAAAILAQNLVGSGVSISNATLNCPGVSNGLFTVTSSNLGLNNGIILTSGRASTNGSNLGANGAGNVNSPSLSTGNGSDPDLALLTAPNASNDKCILEFDFVPQADTIRFEYVFASTEYQNYTCSQYSDVFGFFLSGPGITGPYSNNAKNIALVPGTTCPVGVNTINGSTAATCGIFTAPCTNNGIYFVNNIGGTTVAYNGFTTVLTAKSAVTPNLSHHIKLAVCDGTDDVYDSGVWLKQSSFTSATTSVTQCAPYTWPVNGVTYSVSGTYNFTLPNGNLAILDLTIFCGSNVPTVSEWGLILIILISIGFGMVALFKRERSVAMAGANQMISSDKSSIFDRTLYVKVLTAVMGVAVTSLIASYFYVGSITLTDTIGSVLSAFVVAYILHFYLLMKRSEK